MAPDSINTTGGEISVNGRRYRLPQAAHRRGLHRRLGARLHRARRRGRPRAVVRQGADAGHQPAGRLRRAELHQPQQPLDRHRPAARRARHLRQLLPRSRHGQGGDDERSEVPAGRDAVPGLPARRLPHRRHHRQGQAARPSGQGPGAGRRQGLQLLLGEVRQGDARRERHRGRQRAGRHGRCRTSTAPACRSSCSPPASSSWSATGRRSCISRPPTTSSTSTRPARRSPTTSTP